MLPILQGVMNLASKQAIKTQRGIRGIAVLFLYPQRWMGWVVHATPRPLLLSERDPITIVQGPGWESLDGCGKNSAPPRHDPRTVQPLASR